MDPLRRCRPYAARIVPAAVLGAALGAHAFAQQKVVRAVGTTAAQETVAAASPASDVEIRPLETRTGETFDAEYGWVRVPENRSDPNSRTIEVAYVRVRCGREDAGPPVVYLEGGPGGPGIPSVERMVQGGGSRFFDLIRSDVIGIDQRGVGQSRPNLSTETLYGFSETAPGDRRTKLAVMTRVCAEEARVWREKGADLDGYDTNESADDVDAIRAALGYEEMSLWGSSYGTHLAMAVIRRHEEHVARALLIGPEGPDHTVKLPSYGDDGLARIAELVAANEAIAEHVPDFLALVGDVLESFDDGPRSVEIDGVEVGISRLDVEEWLAGAIGRSADEIAGVPATLVETSRGDLGAIGAEVLRARREDGLWSVMGQVVDAASGASEERMDLIAREAKVSLLGDAMTFTYGPTSAAWGVTDLGDAFRAPLESDVPVLFVVGDLDARTPIRNAEELMEGLPNAQLVVVENAAHSVPLGVPALREAWSGFLRGEPVELVSVDAGPIRFRLPEGAAVAAPEGAVEVEAAELARCEGRFRFSNGMEMEIAAKGSRLVASIRGKGDFDLWPKGPLVFFCVDGPIPDLTFELDDAGEQAIALSGGGARAERVD